MIIYTPIRSPQQPARSRYHIHNKYQTPASIHIVRPEPLLFDMTTMTSSAMSALELAYRMQRISLNGSGNVPMSTTMAARSAYELEFDCSGFDSLPPASSLASSFNSQNSQSSFAESDRGGRRGLSRWPCSHNLSSICSTSADASSRRVPLSAAAPTAGWGYYADTPP